MQHRRLWQQGIRSPWCLTSERPPPPVPPVATLAPPTPNPVLFAGLTPGYAGLYQVNFQLPQVPSGVPACDGIVSSNLTVTLVTLGWRRSFDRVQTCVDVAASPGKGID
jgi:hypothetical protein